MMAPEHRRLQSKAGYIDARPHIRHIGKILLQRTAGPYIRVIHVAPTASQASPNVRYASNSDRICASQRTDAWCQLRTCRRKGLTAALPLSAVITVMLLGQMARAAF